MSGKHRAPGWYQDPEMFSPVWRYRYWTGTEWTDSTVTDPTCPAPRKQRTRWFSISR